MSVEFYTGLQIADATGQTAPVRMRIDGNQSDEASAALQDCVNLLSNGKAIVETGEYYDYMVVQNVDPQSMRYKTYRLTLSDSVTAYKEYIYIPCANTSLLIDDPNYISPGSTLFTQVAQLIEPYYKSRLGNSCSLVAIEYIIQRNTIFPSQVGAATYAPQQVKSVTITDNGQTTIEPDSGYILGRAIVTTNVPETPTQSAEETYTANGEYNILPDIGYALDSVLITVNVPPPSLTRFRIGANYYFFSEMTKYEAGEPGTQIRTEGSSGIVIWKTSTAWAIDWRYFTTNDQPQTVTRDFRWYYYNTSNGSAEWGLLTANSDFFNSSVIEGHFQFPLSVVNFDLEFN